MSRNTCQTCRFWDSFDDERCGDCHRYPPTVYGQNEFGDTMTDCPMTNKNHWCGEWQEARP